ncbi:hypothetical protein DPMN_181919 [Dreissena polymorpha]|uniref:Uncharacterized protein n=1 Tax=Dreissena polymorpha TaxID=45954 RepID=A0A9D4I5Q5_DREPO|nr:hypothetical protein DPMN_181919 [Dreissena polymorpha]
MVNSKLGTVSFSNFSHVYWSPSSTSASNTCPACTSDSDSETGSSPVRRYGRAQNLNFNNVGVDRCNNWRASERVPHLKPEPYSGEEPWESYISHFEDCAELGVWSQRSRVLFLASSLRG